MNALKKFGTAVMAVVLSGAALAQTAPATGPDLSSLTNQISFGTVITAVLAIAAGMVGLYLAVKGAKIVLGMIRGS